MIFIPRNVYKAPGGQPFFIRCSENPEFEASMCEDNYELRPGLSLSYVYTLVRSDGLLYWKEVDQHIRQSIDIQSQS